MNSDRATSVMFQRVCIISLVSVLAFLQLALFLGKNVEALKALSQNGMLVYGCSILLFAAICLTAALKMKRKEQTVEMLLSKKSTFAPTAQKRVFGIAMVLSMALWFHAEFITKKNEFAIGESILFQALQYKLIRIPFCIISVGLMVFVVWYAKRERDVPAWAVWSTYLFICVSEFINKSFFDLFNSDNLANFANSLLYADLYHGTAYRETIYNVYYNIPYTLETTGVYGHYGLFFKPFMHLFHGSPVALSVLIALLQVFSAVCFLYILHQICSENWMRCLGALAMGMPSVIWEHRNYWQACPHRILFPLLILAFFALIARKGKWSISNHIIAFSLGTLAFIWNTETGAFCLITICAVFSVHRWQNDKWFSYKTWMYEGLLILASVISVVCGILCVNLYNIACGGPWILKEFFFPLFFESYMSGNLGYAAPAGNYSWVYILLVLAFLFLFCLRNTSFFCNPSKDRDIPVMAGVSIIGLLNMTYYMNRAAYGNLCITIYFVVLALCWFCKRFLPYWQKLFHSSCKKKYLFASIICTVSIAMLTFCSINTLGILPKTYISTGRFDTTRLVASAESIRESVPEGTYAIGSGLTELYALNGWDTHAHFRDFPDLMVGGSAAFDAVLTETLRHDSFLFYSGFFNEGNALLDRILTEAPYQLIREIPIEGGTVYYYAK